MKNRPFIASDNVGQKCNCLECQAAGVTDKPVVRVPADEYSPRPRWLHGEELKSWYAARERVTGQLEDLRQRLSMPAPPKDGGQA